MTSRGPLTLAALASAAVPGLDPDTVQGVVASGPADAFEVAFIQDREHRRWAIRCPRTPAASAQLERSAALLAVLARRLTMPVPAVKGWVALPEGGRAAVHSYLTGRLVGLEGIEPGSALARGLGRALAHLHNLDPSLYEEAGVPVYDAAGYRSRRLAELDRAAATGRVPTGLLGRWERVLDDETLWTFTSTPTHGDLSTGTILATPDDGEGPDVKAFLGWESAQVADPADDIAPLLAALDAQAFDTVMEAYAHTRVERPDRHLLRRAEIIGEMQLVRTMMSLVGGGDDAGAEAAAAQLRRLDERTAREDDEAARAQDRAAKEAGATATTAASTSAPSGPWGDSTGAASASTDTQPVGIRTSAGSSPDSAEVRDASAGTGEDEEDDVVQVEHPSQVTRVAPVADDEPDVSESGPTESDTADPSDQDTADPSDQDTAGPSDQGTVESPTDSGPRAARDAADSDPDGTAPPTASPTSRARGDDHETAEIVAINDDGGDDVLPPSPRPRR
ncbi:phosphotransferase [Janibacter alittae]|uniref:Phosphotransferase n=1 Tax=Janibacter alittae TaxID=3115209 RepID=A0ABZ2MJE7_9MICO